MGGKILVACVGNIFLGDDAFGSGVAQQLLQTKLPDNVVVRDFGIRSYDLAYALMEQWNLVILVDAMPRGGMPGTVYTIDPELSVKHEEMNAFDAHSMNPLSVLDLVEALGGKVQRMLVVGCEPESVEADQKGRMGLSPAVTLAVPQAVRVIQELVAQEGKSAAA